MRHFGTHCNGAFCVEGWFPLCPGPFPLSPLPWLCLGWIGDHDPAVMSLFRQPKLMALSLEEQECHFQAGRSFFKAKENVWGPTAFVFLLKCLPLPTLPVSGLEFVPVSIYAAWCGWEPPTGVICYPLTKHQGPPQAVVFLGLWSCKCLSVRFHVFIYSSAHVGKKKD